MKYSLLLLFTLLTACAQLPPLFATTSTPQAKVSGCSVQVGILISLTGPLGGGRNQEQLNSMEMARDEINAQGGILGCPLQFVIKDDASVIEKGTAAAKEMAEDSTVAIIVDTRPANAVLAAMVTLDRYDVPVLTPAVSTNLITQIGYRRIFRLAAAQSDIIRTLYNFLQTLPKAAQVRSLATLHQLSTSGRPLFLAVEDEASRRGVALIISEEYKPLSKDYRQQLRRIKSANPDAVLFDADELQDGVAILQQAKELDLNPKMFLVTTGPFVRTAFLRAGSFNEYVLVGSQWTADVPWRDDSGQNAQAFLQKYSARFKAAPDHPGFIMTYTSIYVITRALEEAFASAPQNLTNGPRVRAELTPALRRLKMPNSLFGPIKFDEDGQNQHPVLITQVLGGKYAIVYPEAFRVQAATVPVPGWTSR